MLKGKQKKLDKNNNGRIDAEDFKILQGSKKGMRMGGMMYAQEGGMNSDRMTARDVEAAKARLETSATRNKYRTAQLEKALRSSPKNPDRLTRKDIEKASSAVGKRKGGMLKAKKGRIAQESKGRRMTQDDLKLAKEMSKRDRYKSYSKRVFKSPKEAAEVDIQVQRLMDYNAKKGERDVDVIGMKSYEKPTSKMGSFKKGKMIKARSGTSVTSKVPIDHPDVIRRYNRFPKDKDKTQKYAQYLETHFRDKKAKKMTASEGSFKKGSMIKAKSGTLSESMKKLRKRAYEKSMKKNKKVGRFGDDEYMIQKPLPGMKKGKMIKAKMGKSIELLKVIPTVKRKKQVARDFTPSAKNKKTNKYKDYK